MHTGPASLGTTELLAPVPPNLLASAAHLTVGGTSC
jgi:hypothetical protein